MVGACLLGLLWAQPARADQGWEGQSLSATWENDATRTTDRHYTQGAMLRYLSSDTATPQWLRRCSEHIPDVAFATEGVKFGVEVGQQIYTPEDLDAVDVVKGDRPYAGWLYLGTFLQRRGRSDSRWHLPVMEGLRLDVGVIGPESQAEDTQKVWHGKDPRGWRNQLKTEPGLVLRYERAYLLRLPHWGHFALDGLPSVDAAAGNVDVHAGVKGTVRWGYNIPNTFEVPGKQTPKGFGAYIFGSLGGRIVVHSIFLDGNTWRDSHRVDHEPLVGYAGVGLAVVLGPVEIIGSNNYISHEFRRQHRSDSYGSVSVTYKF